MTITRRRLRLIALLPVAALLSLAGCSRYQMTVNETVVYSPPSLFTDFQVEDRKLKDCLDQTIEDNRHTASNQVTRLSCTHAGITSLAGLEQFQHLTELNLGNNQLTSIEPLKFHFRLKILLLNDNRLVSAAELLQLPNLTLVDLDSNPGLACADVLQLKQSFNGQLRVPQQCRKD
ncbi:MAG: leucine-rich repeat domain-containing protein [Gammaproteobacteria bacterium]|uniref:leucine-rich repeat domain-containing protein n=1 Tax=Pseudomaricurvus alcaniphilus TaxID=1166482 RepID=UPI00140DD119|nr:leucine-rich repeat domain-containing protein [Pseudomaricurvus alcaniphilus]MBR9912808.1 leucine-rich repeat domain-containing protein [Gammaproteobacteria bacterium]NHN37788.1 leucine-rich repeat domain-containing protein [Pseudomaricurvus alcaniphilus]